MSSQNLTMSIPHQLTRAEAKRRIEQGIAQARTQYGGMLSGLTENWEGDTLSFTLSAMGQSISGKAFVEDQAVRPRPRQGADGFGEAVDVQRAVGADRHPGAVRDLLAVRQENRWRRGGFL